MSRVRVQIMNQFERKSHKYKAMKRYWKLIQQDSRKLSDKRFYRPTFRMHLTNKEILELFGDDPKLQASIDKDPSENYQEGLLELYKKIRPGEPLSVDSSRSVYALTLYAILLSSCKK